jgi:hypothetical protein
VIPILVRATHTVTQLRRSLLITWLILGVPVVTLILCCIYGPGWLLWGYLHDPDLHNLHFYEIAIVALLASITGFAIASIAQAVVYFVLPLYGLMLLCFTGRASLPLLLLSTPLLGLLIWFGYEHFVPDFRLYFDQSPPYRYGLTLKRFLTGWGLEVAIVLLYWWPFRRVNLSSNSLSQADVLR